MVFPDVTKVTEGLRHHLGHRCEGCPYSERPSGCLNDGLMTDALKVIEEQTRMLDEIDDLVSDLEGAVKELEETEEPEETEETEETGA